MNRVWEDSRDSKQGKKKKHDLRKEPIVFRDSPFSSKRESLRSRNNLSVSLEDNPFYTQLSHLRLRNESPTNEKSKQQHVESDFSQYQEHDASVGPIHLKDGHASPVDLFDADATPTPQGPAITNLSHDTSRMKYADTGPLSPVKNSQTLISKPDETSDVSKVSHPPPVVSKEAALPILHSTSSREVSPPQAAISAQSDHVLGLSESQPEPSLSKSAKIVHTAQDKDLAVQNRNETTPSALCRSRNLQSPTKKRAYFRPYWRDLQGTPY
eukprot:Rmarinus@m.13551